MATSIIGEAIDSISITNADYLRSSIYFRKSGNVCCVSYASDIKNIPSRSYLDIGTVPERFRPKTMCMTRVVNNSKMIVIEISPLGSIQMYNYDSDPIDSNWANGGFSAAYIVSS